MLPIGNKNGYPTVSNSHICVINISDPAKKHGNPNFAQASVIIIDQNDTAPYILGIKK